MKKSLSVLLCAALALTMLAGCGPKNPGGTSSSGSISSAGSSSREEAKPYEGPVIDFMALNGPTGVGAAWLMKHYSEEALTAGSDAPFALNAQVAADNQEVTNALINGDADIAAIATNVAANLAAKSDGAIRVLAVNTLGVLYILEKGEGVYSMADLAGKTLYAPSNTRGANPEHILNHLLAQNGVEPGQVDVQWLTPQEITAKMTSSDAGICMLPVPAATALMVQDSGVRQAISLSEVWEDLEGSTLPMGCLVARSDYIEENPEVVDAFLDLYGDSITFMTEEGNADDAAGLMVEFGLAPKEPVARAAIPQCNLTLLTGGQMRSVLENYYAVLFDAAPESIGGGLPYDSFYYGAE